VLLASALKPIKGASFGCGSFAHKWKRPLRTLYAFDPSRRAVLLTEGQDRDDRFYERMTPIAERI